jgi:hypothetical protein
LAIVLTAISVIFAVDNTKAIIFSFLVTKMKAFSRTHQLKDSIMNMIAAPHCSTAAVVAAASRWLRSPTLTGLADAAINRWFQRDNREALPQLRQADREAWNTVEHRLVEHGRELREGIGTVEERNE